MSFKKFILEPSAHGTPERNEFATSMKQLRLETNFDNVDEPRTPTQARFET